MIEILLIGQCLLCVILVSGWVYTLHTHQNAMEREHELWRKERKDLLDRIQSPSFDHYKAAEVKVIKAQKPEEEKKPFEFV